MTHSTGSCYLADEAATVACGAALASVTTRGGLITLSGDLGAGKTTFSRGLIQACGHHGAVKSPTYTLVEVYELPDRSIAHFDLYRLTDPEELHFIGFRDYLQPPTLCLVEWPEKAGRLMPIPDLQLSLTLQGKARCLHWQAQTEAGELMASALDAALTRQPSSPTPTP